MNKKKKNFLVEESFDFLYRMGLRRIKLNQIRYMFILGVGLFLVFNFKDKESK